MSQKISREADGVRVSFWTHAWPIRVEIEHVGYSQMALTNLEEAEGLYYALGKILEIAQTRKGDR